MCFQPEIQGADLVSLKYCTASAHQVSCGEVRLEPQLLADAGCETPAINYKRFNGRKYRCQDIFDIWIPNPRLSFINISWFPFKIFQQSLLFRYFYAISSDVAIEHPGRLVKVDTKTSKVKPITVESFIQISPGGKLERRQLLLLRTSLHSGACGGEGGLRLAHLFLALGQAKGHHHCNTRP